MRGVVPSITNTEKLDLLRALLREADLKLSALFLRIKDTAKYLLNIL